MAGVDSQFSPRPERRAGLIEEVARVRGYHQIPTEVPRVSLSIEGTSRKINFIRRVREAAAAAGLNEAVNYAFVSQRELLSARAPGEAVKLANPLSEERSMLRTSLLPGLAANLLRAQNHQVKRFEQFELARVFEQRAGQPLPAERYQLGVILWGPRQQWYGDGEELDFYDGKGAISAIFLSYVASYRRLNSMERLEVLLRAFTRSVAPLLKYTATKWDG